MRLRWDGWTAVLALAGCLALGALVSSPGPNGLDAAVQRAASGHPGLADAAAWVGWLLPFVVQVLLLAALVLLLLAGEWRLALAIAVLLFAGDSAVDTLKGLFARVRPDTATFSSFSYPSGHAASAAAQWGFLFLAALPALVGHERPPRWMAVAWLVPTVACAAARVLEGEHWATDVLGGALLGVALACLASRLGRPDPRPQKTP